jgi:hypothetical protein
MLYYAHFSVFISIINICVCVHYSYIRKYCSKCILHVKCGKNIKEYKEIEKIEGIIVHNSKMRKCTGFIFDLKLQFI